MGKHNPKNGLPTTGLYQMAIGKVSVTKLTDKDRKAITKLFLTGHNKGFIDREEDGERIIWELALFKYE